MAARRLPQSGAITMEAIFASTRPRGASKTGTCGAIGRWRWRSWILITRIAIWRCGVRWQRSQSREPTRISICWPRSIWEKTSIRSVSQAKCASSTKSVRHHLNSLRRRVGDLWHNLNGIVLISLIQHVRLADARVLSQDLEAEILIRLEAVKPLHVGPQ